MSERKYRIKEVIDSKTLSRKEARELRKRIRKRVNVSASTLSLWENYRLESKQMIPADQLLKVSQVLNLKCMEELFNVKMLVNNEVLRTSTRV